MPAPLDTARMESNRFPEAVQRELDAGLAALRLDPDLATPLLAYLALLDRWNRTYNLTAVRDPADMLRDATPDTGCGIKLFERAAFLELPYFNHMHRYLPALMQRAGSARRHRAGRRCRPARD